MIVGRPNVGKSTLFNYIIGQRRSIVGDEPGITRDRIIGDAEHCGRRFQLIDTGGIITDDRQLIPAEILRQARFALEGAAQIIFLVDGRSETTSADRELLLMLRQLGRPVTLAVNKIDVASKEESANEYYSLGIPHLFPISAEHRTGVAELLDHITKDFAINDYSVEEVEDDGTTIKVAIIGRPNVGKSTLLNALTGTERSIVTSVAGTTRDAVDERVEHNGVEYVFVDTAGIRRKGKTWMMAEKLSVVMARRHIRMSHVVVLVIDASEGVVASDATVAGYAHEEGRALILCVNKWDITKEKSQKEFAQQVRDECKFLEYASITFISAMHGTGVKKLFALIGKAFESASKRVTTGELNRFVDMLTFDTDVKVKYITQASIRPPTFVVFTDKIKQLHFSTERFLINQLRKRFGFEGTPIVVKTKRS